MGNGLPGSYSLVRATIISLAAVALQCCAATQAAAQLRSIGGTVSTVGGGISGITGGIGSAAGGIGSAGGITSGVTGGVGGLTGTGGGLGGITSGVTGGVGGVTGTVSSGLSGNGFFPGIAIPFDGQGVTGTVLGSASAIAGSANSIGGDIALPSTSPLNSVTNSLAGSVRGLPRIPNASTGPPGAGPSSRSPPASPLGRSSGVPPPGERRYLPREIIVGLTSDLSERTLADFARRHRLAPIEAHQVALVGMTYHRWRILDGRSVADVIREVESERDVRSAQPNYRFTLAQTRFAALPQAGGEALQYAPGKIHLAEAHRLATGAKVLIAVIDSGVDTSHPEIAAAVADRVDIAPPGPPHPHGTAMAGAIVARAQLTGTAPGARLLAIRAFNDDPGNQKAEATTLNIVRSLDWAMARGARVINMSFAGPYDPDVAHGLAAARQKGAVLVAAAGNAGAKSAPLYPAADKNVIAVTAVNRDNQLFAAANRGRHIAVAAPGVDVLVPSPGERYGLTTGTSVAAAEVSGIAALLIERNPVVTPEEVRSVLQSTAFDLGPKGFDEQFGAGLVDAERAVQSLGPADARALSEMLFSERWPDTTLLRPSQQ